MGFYIRIDEQIDEQNTENILDFSDKTKNYEWNEERFFQIKYFWKWIRILLKSQKQQRTMPKSVHNVSKQFTLSMAWLVHQH